MPGEAPAPEAAVANTSSMALATAIRPPEAPPPIGPEGSSSSQQRNLPLRPQLQLPVPGLPSSLPRRSRPLHPGRRLPPPPRVLRRRR